MENIDVIFSRSNLVFSKAVRRYTHSEWSHGGILINSGTVLESTFSHRGVKLASLDDFKSRATATRIVSVAVPNRAAAIHAGMAQINKPYDYTAIAGILANKRNWQEDDMWFCTELCAFVVQSGGALYFPPADIPLITPQRLLVALSKPCPKYA